MTTSSGTQGSGSISKAARIAAVVISTVGFSGTSNSYASLVAENRTSSSLPVSQPKSANEAVTSTGKAVMEIRQMADLTWEETATLFGVSRRAVHHWAGGSHPAARQERQINRIHGVLRSLSDSSSPSSLRQQLMTSAQPGKLFFDLLCADEIENFISLFPHPTGPIAIARPLAPGTALNQYAPPPPTSLMGALQDRPIADSKAIPAKSVRFGRRST